jgi:anaphase-promoting complex subunit 4
MPYSQYVAGVHDDIQISLLECSVREFGEEGSTEVDVLDVEFFDDETLVLVYQAKETQGKESMFRLYPTACINENYDQGPMFVATVNYTTLGYHILQSERYVSGPARIDMMASVLQRRKEGHVSLVFWPCFRRDLACGVFTDGMAQVPCNPIPITKCRRLSGCKNGPVSLAVNGRAGRRVVCVLDVDGTTMEVLDTEGEELEGEEEAEMEVVGP